MSPLLHDTTGPIAFDRCPLCLHLAALPQVEASSTYRGWLAARVKVAHVTCVCVVTCAGSLEGQHAIVTGKLVSLSEQELVDCSGKFGNEGCNGGEMEWAYDFIISRGSEGVCTEESYPYRAHVSDLGELAGVVAGLSMPACIWC